MRSEIIDIFCVLRRYIWEVENPGSKMLSSVLIQTLFMWVKLLSLGKADLTKKHGRDAETVDGGIEATDGHFFPPGNVNTKRFQKQNIPSQ